MVDSNPHFLFIEPYYGGSHKAFIQGLAKHVDARFDLITLPPRKWKMRMQLAAPYMAEQVIARVREGAHYDGVITSTFIDVAVFRDLLAADGIRLPTAVYFHENQFAYPSRPQDQTRHQFSAINFTTAMCADSLAFNSRYNQDTFFSGIRRYLKKAADMSFEGTVERLAKKSVILHPGLDYSLLDETGASATCIEQPVIVWNHRWEHDKNPEGLFVPLMELARDGVDFKLIILGESFRDQPEIFTRVRNELQSRILHFGFAENLEDYYRLLKAGTIAVSTAIHEFFGLAMLEAVRAGCLPLVPDRLAYRELFPQEYRFRAIQFKKDLKELLIGMERLADRQRLHLTEPYSWVNLSSKYEEWLQGLSRISAVEISAMSAKKTPLRK